MLNIVLSVILIISIVIILFIGAYTLVRCSSKKRNVFIGLLVAGFMLSFGYLLELNAYSTGEAFLAKRIMYIGAVLSPPLLLIFLADYCEIKINRKLIALILAAGLAFVTVVWTTALHKLYYVSFELDTSTAVRFLSRKTGPLNMFGHAYIFSSLFFGIVILIYKYIKLDAKNRPMLTLLMAGTFCCLVSNILYLVKPFGLVINYGPLASGLYSGLFCISIIKYNMFDIIPIASEMALSSMRDAFFLIDINGDLLSANESAKNLFPSARKMNKYSPITQIDNWPAELSSISKKEYNGSVKFTMSGENYYNASINPIFVNNDKYLGCMIIIQNITESVLFTRRLEEIAYKDALTGILSRRQFMTLAETQFKRTRRLNEDAYIIIFDIDHFKIVNDTYGHLIGDKVLQGVVKRVNETIRPYDLFGRYGGEEFILFAFEINETDIFKFAERIRLAICGSPMVFEDKQLTVSASFGVAPTISANSLEGIIKLGDEALYKAKDEGRNKVVLTTLT